MSDGLIPTILRFKLNKINVYTKKIHSNDKTLYYCNLGNYGLLSVDIKL